MWPIFQDALTLVRIVSSHLPVAAPPIRLHSGKDPKLDRSPLLARRAGLALALALCATPLHAESLVLNGKTASTDVRTLNGAAYVKLADVAKALGMVLVKRPGGYELTRAGGANQVQGVSQGKVGDVLFDGRWRFQVLGVETPESYTMKVPSVEPSSHPRDLIRYDRAAHVLRPQTGYKLVVLQCRMSNGQKTTQTFWLANAAGRSINTALADTQGESYAPVGYDLEGAPIQSKPMLPGSKTDFALLFSIPEASEIKDLVFTLTNNDSQGTNDVRVALKHAP